MKIRDETFMRDPESRIEGIWRFFEIQGAINENFLRKKWRENMKTHSKVSIK